MTVQMPLKGGVHNYKRKKFYSNFVLILFDFPSIHILTIGLVAS